MTYTLYHGDCLNILPTLEAGSVDAVITDPPYGTTACKWDSVIPFASMWAGIKHVIRERAAMVLFGSQPFTSALVMSNIDWFKYCWVWEKTLPSGYAHAKNKPMKIIEDILVFSAAAIAHEAQTDNRMTYNPQMKRGKPYKKKNNGMTRYKWSNHIRPSSIPDLLQINTGERYPVNLIKISNGNHKSFHPTQKPVALMEYLIKTYTNEGDTVLDFTMGSGTTGVACMRTGRNFIGIELDADYFRIAEQRIANAAGDIMLTDKERESGARMLPLF